MLKFYSQNFNNKTYNLIVVQLNNISFPMKSNGKQLEKLSWLIQETIKNSPSTVVHANHKLKNNKGRNREFDLIIVSNVNNFTITIAIECKEYKTPISVEKIEAFHGKCVRFPQINKKIFISQSGYQADAFNAADDHGISLYDLKDVNKDAILSWLSVKMLGLRFNIRKYEVYLDLTEEEIKALPTFSKKSMLHFPASNTPSETVDSFLTNIFYAQKNEIWGYTIYEWMKYNSFDRITSIPFKIGLKDVYMVSPDGYNVPLIGLTGILDTMLIEQPANVLSSKIYGQSQGNIEAQYLAIEVGNDEKADFIFTKDRLQVYHTSPDGTSAPLKWLWTYDRNTDTFKRDETTGNPN